MINVNIGTTTDDPRKLDKTISWIGSNGTATDFKCVPTDTCDILYPVLILAYSSTIAISNYAYIAELGRYYFITDPALITGGRIMIKLAVDVLSTYATDIKNCPCCITRNQNIGINWVPDDKLPYNTEITITQPTQGGFNTPFSRSPDMPWILTVINDVGTVYPTQGSEKKWK